MLNQSFCNLLPQIFGLFVLTIFGWLSPGFDGVLAQDHDPESMVLPLLISVDVGQTCPGLELVTATLTGLTSPEDDIQSVIWTVVSDGGVNDNSFVLDPNGPGPELTDWSLATSLAFTPLEADLFFVSATIIYNGGTSQSTILPAQVMVGEAPSSPYISPFNSFFCESEPLQILTSAANNDNLMATLCWEVVDASGVIIENGCDGPTTNTILTENVGIPSLNEGCYDFNLTLTHLCGTATSNASFEVLQVPEFALSSQPTCDGEEMVVESTFDPGDYMTCNGNSANGTWQWSPTALDDNVFSDATFLNLDDGEEVCQSAFVTYVSGDQTETCLSTQCTEVVVHIPDPMEWEVTYPVTFPPACSGDDIEVTATGVGTFQWVVFPLPQVLGGGIDPITGVPINQTAEFENVQAPGISGDLIRTITFYDGTQCVDSLPVDIDISPRPDIEWVDTDFLAICEDSTEAQIEVAVTYFNEAPLTLLWTLVENTTEDTLEITTTLDQTDLDAGVGGILTFEQLLNFPDFLADLEALSLSGVSSSSVTITLVAQDSNGCTSLPIFANIQYFDVPTPSAEFQPVCEGSTVIPDNVPVGGYSYLWEVNGNSIPNNSTSWQPPIDGLQCDDVVTLTMSATYQISASDVLFCDANSEDFTIEVIPLPDLQIVPTTTICEGDDVTLEASDLTNDLTLPCWSSGTDFFWEYTVDGLIWEPGSFNPPIVGDFIVIPGGDHDTIWVQLTAINHVDTIVGLSCQIDSSYFLDLLPRPVIDTLINPLSICLEDEGTLGALAVSDTGIANYTWLPCFEETSALNIDNLDPLSGDATFEVSDPSMSPEAACLLLEVTDNAGCMAYDSLVVDIHPMPSVGGLTMMLPATQDTINALCDCTDSVAFIADFPQLGNLDGDDAESSINFLWTVTWQDGTVLPLEQDGTNYATGYPCLGQLANFCDLTEVPVLSVHLEVESDSGCFAQFNWVDTLHVVPSPEMEPSCSMFVCNGQPWDCAFECLDFVCFEDGNDTTCFENSDGSVDVVIPFDYINYVAGSPAVFNDVTGPIEGGVSWTPPSGGTTVTCYTTSTFSTAVLNVSTPIITVSETSGVVNDDVVCEGSDVNLQASGYGGSSNTFNWIVNGNSIGGTASATWNSDASDGACTEAVNVEILLEFEQAYNPTLTSETCHVTVSDSISVLPMPVAEGSLEALGICDTDPLEATLTASCGIPLWNENPMTWNWNIPGNGGTATGDSLDLTAAVSFGGPDCSESQSQTLIATLTDGYGCSSEPIALTFEALELPNLTFEGSPVCSEDDLEIEVCGADSYQWDVTFGAEIYLLDSDPAPSSCCPGDVRETIVHTDPMACNVDGIDVTGTLIHTINGNNVECSSTANYNCVVFENPVIDPSLSEVLCEGDAVLFDDLAGGGVDIEFDFSTNQGLNVSNSSNSNVTFTAFPDTTCFGVVKTEFFEAVGNTYSCESTWDTCFAVKYLPVISVTHPTSTCQGEDVAVSIQVTNSNDLDDNCTYNFNYANLTEGVLSIENGGNGVDDFIDYSLVNSGGIASIASNPMVAEFMVECGGCSSNTYTMNVDVLSTPVVTQIVMLQDSLCSPASDCIELQVDNVDLPATTLTEYFFGGNPASTTPQFCDNFVNSSSCPLMREVEWIVRFTHATSDGSTLYCATTGMDSTIVSPTPQPAFQFNEVQDCFDPGSGNEIDILHALADYNLCPEDSLSIQWYASAISPLNPSQVHLAEATAVVPELSADGVGQVEVILEISNIYGCSQTTAAQTFTVQDLPTPQLTFQQNSICLPTTVTIINSSSGASDFVLDIPGYPTMPNFASPLTLNVAFPGYYNAEFEACKDHVIGTSTITCCSDIEYVAAFEGCTPPVASFEVDTLLEFVNPVVEFENTSEGQTQNIWSFGDGEGSSELDPEHEYLSTGEYNAQLLVVNECGCTDVASQVIEVANDVYLYVPNAFTPNNDGLNDAWLPSITGQNLLAKYECWVFNRSGHLVFHTTNLNKAWTGENNITGAGDHFTGTSDVYSWRIALKKNDGRGADIYTGHVTMVR